MTRRKTLLAITVVATLAAMMLLSSVASAATTPGPAWRLTVASTPTNFAPEEEAGFAGNPQYTIIATNIGGKTAEGPIKLTDTLPDGLTPYYAEGYNVQGLPVDFFCDIDGQTVTCTSDGGPIRPGDWVYFPIYLEIDDFPDPTIVTNSATISGGGAPIAGATTSTTITSSLPDFDFVSGAAGLSASLTEPDGSPTTQAGAHPYRLSVDLATPSKVEGFSVVAADGGLRDASVTLPRGVIVNPLATSVRCTEAQLESSTCPDASQVGSVTINTVQSTILPAKSPLYNMAPPPGEPATFGFDAVGVGIFVHISGGIRAGDYALTSDSNDILGLGVNPLLSFQAQFWGDPSSPSHDFNRGLCTYGPSDAKCPVPPQDTPLLTTPTSCGDELSLDVAIDSWGHPDDLIEKSAPFTDAEGSPTGVVGCNALAFEPSLKARPTTNVADAPSGLEAELEIPQTSDHNTLATAHLKKAVVTLPEGLVINPASANGLDGCTSTQAGIDPDTGVADGKLPSCPNASKIGTVEVTTPLLDHPLPGAVYVATPKTTPSTRSWRSMSSSMIIQRTLW